MPKILEAKLKKEANHKGLIGNQAASYTYGTMKKIEKKKNSKNLLSK